MGSGEVALEERLSGVSGGWEWPCWEDVMAGSSGGGVARGFHGKASCTLAATRGHLYYTGTHAVVKRRLDPKSEKTTVVGDDMPHA